MASERAASEPGEFEIGAAEIVRLWQGRDLTALAGDATRHVTAGTATDWGMSVAVDTPIPPVTLGGVVVLGIDAAMAVLCYVLLRKGWKLKN